MFFFAKLLPSDHKLFWTANKSEKSSQMILFWLGSLNKQRIYFVCVCTSVFPNHPRSIQYLNIFFLVLKIYSFAVNVHHLQLALSPTPTSHHHHHNHTRLPMFYPLCESNHLARYNSFRCFFLFCISQ